MVEEASRLADSCFNTSILMYNSLKDLLDELLKKSAKKMDLVAIFNAGLERLTGETLINTVKNLFESNDIDDYSFNNILSDLYANLDEVYTKTIITEDSYKKALATLNSENQMLADISQMDPNGIFYYSAPIDPVLAIDLNEDEPKLNTLMNPLFNYDINNVLNNFVISKIDFDYLDKGIKIARSSKISTY